MQSRRIGRQTVGLPSRPAVCSGAAFVGKAEGEGPLGERFDGIASDELYGQDTFELAEKQLFIDAVNRAINKAALKPGDIEFLLGGDLLNQIITASFAARDIGVPFIGLYGACSTMAEGLAIGAMLIDGGYASRVVCATGSHFCTAERQFRFPLEFGSQRTPTAQWTVTGAGATVLCSEPTRRPLAHITQACIGRVCDLGVTDANNMGAAMAPAAADTLLALLNDTQTTPDDYDLILTGDLGQVGSDLLTELMQEHNVPLSTNKAKPNQKPKHNDCGLMIYDREKQDVHAGGSGCGCGASVLNAHILPQLALGQLKRVIFIATGALMSLTSSQQGESIPGVAHAVVLEAPDMEDR